MLRRIVALLIASLLLPAALAGQTYRQITQEEASRIMHEEKGYIVLDVRTREEFDEGHIPGATNLPNESIGEAPPAELPDLNQVILVYCRSGRRSKEAAEKLAALGYTQVLEFGGIITWPGGVVPSPAQTPAASAEPEYEAYADPFLARDYSSPEDFYEDYMDDFYDYEDAEDYYYENGGW